MLICADNAKRVYLLNKNIRFIGIVAYCVLSGYRRRDDDDGFCFRRIDIISIYSAMRDTCKLAAVVGGAVEMELNMFDAWMRTIVILKRKRNRFIRSVSVWGANYSSSSRHYNCFVIMMRRSRSMAPSQCFFFAPQVNSFYDGKRENSFENRCDDENRKFTQNNWIRWAGSMPLAKVQTEYMHSVCIYRWQILLHVHSRSTL